MVPENVTLEAASSTLDNLPKRYHTIQEFEEISDGELDEEQERFGDF